MHSSSSSRPELTGVESKIYDRQIRLWGFDVQNRIRNSSVLVVGASGLGAEVIKNLMLAGIKSLTIMDDKNVSQDDLFSQFLVSRGSISKNRAEASKAKVHELNPMVELIASAENIDTKQDDYFLEFDLIILVDQPYQTTDKINKICRRNKKRFIAGGIFGFAGYAFFDFNNHSFLVQKQTKELDETIIEDDIETSADNIAKKAKIRNPTAMTIVTLEDAESEKIHQIFSYPSFEKTIKVDLSSKRFFRRRFSTPSSFHVIRALLLMDGDSITLESLKESWKKSLNESRQNEESQAFSENDLNCFICPPLNPVCAIVGSVVGQEAIKALSNNEKPLKNIFFYSTFESAGFVMDLSL